MKEPSLQDTFRRNRSTGPLPCCPGGQKVELLSRGGPEGSGEVEARMWWKDGKDEAARQGCRQGPVFSPAGVSHPD